MGIELIRLDDRLIHGQVCIGWTRRKGVNVILAVDDATAANKMQCQLMKMATPPGVTPVFLKTQEAIDKLKSNAYGNKKAMLLVKSVKALYDIVNAGIEITDVNFGNLRTKGATNNLYGHVIATDEEVSMMKELSAKGVKMIAQDLPDAQSCNLNDVLKKF